jgi:hypothetical protein
MPLQFDPVTADYAMVAAVAGTIGLGILPGGFFNLATQAVDGSRPCCAKHRQTIREALNWTTKVRCDSGRRRAGGSAAALTMAKAGLSVVMIERGTSGSKI